MLHGGRLMKQNNNYSLWAIVVLLAVFLQVAFVLADTRVTARDAAISFSTKYFLADACMADYVCSELAAGEDGDPVGEYIQSVADQASQRGLPVGYLKKMLFHIKTETIEKTDEKASYKIVAKSRVHINPLYYYVGKLFHLGETHDVEGVVDLIKENGKWKVCGSPFSLKSSV